MPETPRVIVPVAVLEGEVLQDALVEFLSTVPVVLLGYHEIPEQTLPEQARDELGEQASAELESLTERFESHGATVETRLTFTHDLTETVERVLEQIDRGVVLFSNPVQEIEHVLVAVNRDVLIPATAATTAALVGPTDAAITLMYLGSGDEEPGERLLSGMTTTLEEAGISSDRITRRVEPTTDPITTLADVSAEHDLIIFTESDPSILDRIVGSVSDRLSEKTLTPLLVVQQPLEK